MYNAMSWLQAIKLLLNAQYIRQVNSVVYFYSRLESFFIRMETTSKTRLTPQTQQDHFKKTAET